MNFRVIFNQLSGKFPNLFARESSVKMLPPKVKFPVISQAKGSQAEKGSLESQIVRSICADGVSEGSLNLGESLRPLNRGEINFRESGNRISFLE